jgi:uncharacterized membrane protein
MICDASSLAFRLLSVSIGLSSMQTSNEPPPNFLFYWISLASLTVLFVLGLILWPPYFDHLAQGYKAATATLFFGRFHPIVVHLPVGMLALWVLIELGCFSASVEAKWREMAMLTAFATTVGSVLTVMFGIFLAREGGYKGGAYILHQALGIVATFGLIIACFLRVGWMTSERKAWLDGFRFFLFASAGILGLGAHFGGNMVHGSKYLTEYAPAVMAKPMQGVEGWMMSFFEDKKKPADKETPKADTKPKADVGTTTPVAPAGGDKLVFNDVILPLLESRCNKCHNADKSKGDLRMDTYELAMKGGENGKNFVPGKPEDSLSIQRSTSTEDDDDHMPPKGKDQPTKEEIALLSWWVKEGASDKLKLAEAKVPAELKTIVDGILKK